MKMYLLKGHNLSYWIYIKKCLLTKRHLLKGYNHLDINSGLYSLDDYFFPPKKLVSNKHNKSCGYSPKLLFVEPNKLDYILRTSL